MNDPAFAFGTGFESSATDFGGFALDWMEHMQLHWKRSHRLTVEGIIRGHLVPAFGQFDVREIDRRVILRFRSWLARKPGRRASSTLSAQRINNVMTVLSMVLDEAETQLDIRNPVRGVKRLQVGKSDVQPFTMEEVRRILEHVRPDFRNYYRVRFFTGMRTGEIDGLQWRYVDFDRNQILVRETMVRGQIETPKTPRSRREIEMSRPVRQALEQQYTVSGASSDFVFSNTRGRALSYNNVSRRIWYPLLEELELQPRKPYQTRHTAATLWLASGENPEWIARQLGHANTQMLFSTYARYVPNLTRRDGSAFEELLAERGFAEA